MNSLLILTGTCDANLESVNLLVSTQTQPMDERNSFVDIVLCSGFGGKHFKQNQTQESPDKMISCSGVIQNLGTEQSNIVSEETSICNVLTRAEQLSLMCKQKCTLQIEMEINVKTARNNLQIIFMNMTIMNSVFVLQNILVLFKNVTLEHVDFIDISPRPGELGQIVLEFSNCFIDNTRIKLNQTSGVSVLVDHSTGSNFHVNLSALSLFISATESSFSRSYFHLSADVIVTILYLVEFLNGIHSPLAIHGNKLFVDSNIVTIQNSAGGLVLVKKSSGMLDSWLEADIFHSVFINNTKFGSGGAVMILFVECDHSHSTYSIVEIKYSVFLSNTVKPTSALSKGGALAILHEKSQAECAELQVLVSGSIFADNTANEGGGAIYSSQGHTSLVLNNCTFKRTSVHSLVSSGIFVLSYSDTSIDNCEFTTTGGQESTSILDLQLFNEQQSLQELTATVSCPQWYSVTIFNEKKTIPSTGEDMLKKCSISCSSCPPSFYLPSDGNFVVSYNNKSTTVEANVKTFRSQSNMECLKCPPGAECPGNNVRAKPNFWGYKCNNILIFYQCPLGYCCQGNAESPCNKYDSCSRNREGLLCGKCKTKFAISIFSEKCIAEEYCKDSWIWPLAVSATVLYMLWYTFKDIFLQTITTRVLHLFRCSSSKSMETDKGYFGLLIYFVQTQALITLSLSSMTKYKIDKTLQQINFYVKLLLTFELSTVSQNVCPSKHFNHKTKVQMKFLFLLGIYVAWVVFYLFSRVTKHFLSEHQRKSFSIQDTFVNGLIEIMKYTYTSLSDVMFYSLICVMIGDVMVWFYDGSEKCFSIWQISMMLFGLLHIFPFPLALFIGLKKLINNQLSSSIFLTSLCFPGPFLAFWFISSLFHVKGSFKVSVENINNKEMISSESKAMFQRFKGGYRISDRGTQYWESVVICRRLVLCSTILIPNLMVRLITCIVINSISLGHHMWTKPFIYLESNVAEAFSLFLLVLSAAINFLKSSFIQEGNFMESRSVSIFQFLTLCETLMLPSLILFICLLEICFKDKKQAPR